jgi:7-cyano-7-deazaguanine reductase
MPGVSTRCTRAGADSSAGVRSADPRSVFCSSKLSNDMTTRPSKSLESFPNPAPARDYEIRFECPEFTCMCPRTGQPDFGTIRIRYTPNELCVELKSLKLYLWSFRDEGHFHEAVTNRILDDLVALLAPRKMTVEGDFLVRGGIHTVVEARHP